jgi:hypothetical protein
MSKFDELQDDITTFRQERHIDFHENVTDDTMDDLKKRLNFVL